MESHGGDGVDGLSPAEALASAAAARETLARRVAFPWILDAFLATGTGLYMWLLMEPPYPWFMLALAPWPLAGVWIRVAWERRRGVVADGLKRRVSNHMRWWFIGGILAVWITAGALDVGWGNTHFYPVAAASCAALLFATFRWINGRVVEAIREAP